MSEYSTVYGRFYRNGVPVSGVASFVPRHQTVVSDGVSYTYSPLVYEVAQGVLVQDGTPGVTIPAIPGGMAWTVIVVPPGFTSVIQSFPGDVISLGD